MLKCFCAVQYRAWCGGRGHHCGYLKHQLVTTFNWALNWICAALLASALQLVWCCDCTEQTVAGIRIIMDLMCLDMVNRLLCVFF